MLNEEPFPGIIIRGRCSCGLDASESEDWAGSGAAPAMPSPCTLLLLASLELFECLFSGDDRRGACGDAVRSVSAAAFAGGGVNCSSVRRFEDGALFFF
jgi:hypothetical protein